MDVGAWSILPPLVAILLAIVTRRVIVSLLTGIIVGLVILTVKNLSESWETVAATWEISEWLYLPIQAATEHFGTNLVDTDHLLVFTFTMLMAALVCLIYRNGGMLGVIEPLGRLARGRRGGQVTTWSLGLVVFFDDYANTLLVGNTMRPLTDRLKISREKLAYLVDSTAAPVSGLMIISTWIAGEIGYINDGFNELGLSETVNGFDVFIRTIPYRFYVLLALIFVPMVALLGRDFGPMLAAERRALRGAGKATGDGKSVDSEPVRTSHWLNAVLPILVMILTTVLLLVATGRAKVPPDDATFFNLFSNGDSYIALFYGSLAGLITAMLLTVTQQLMPLTEMAKAIRDGAKSVVPALAILWLAWTLSGITKAEHLGTGEYLAALLQGNVSIQLMPTLVFVLASCVAFATGTSWGTMGILMPLVVRVTYAMLHDESASVSPTDTIMLASIGSVLAGAIFGDHCSPISDTTVLSSQASGCDHVAHVWTQLPYALVVGTVAILCGTLPIGFGVPVWILLPAGVLVLLGFLRLFGRRADELSD